MASNLTYTKHGVEFTYVEHSKVGQTAVPSSLLEHYADKGWKPAKSIKSTADQPASNAPAGA